MIANAEQIKEAARIEEVVGGFIELKKKGANLMACCPFHGEKTPSFSVNPARNIYKCFGCDKAGDPVKFVMDYQNTTYPEALELLAKKYGIAVEYDREQPGFEENETLRAALTALQNAFQSTGSLGRGYFAARGLTPDTMDEFGIGFCAGSVPGLTADTLIKAGLANEKGKIYFYNRATLPIRNEKGAIVSFAGRTIEAGGAPKYLNGAESPIFSKSKVLFGLWENMEYIRKYKLAIIVEGYADVMGLYQHGCRQAVAACGTSLTDEQCRLLARYAPKAIILMDGDAAGQKAAKKAALTGYAHFESLQVVLLDNGDDPDSYVRENGFDALFKRLKKAQDAGVFYCTDGILFGTQAGKKAVGDRLRELMQTVDDTKRAALVDTVAARLGISAGALMRYVFPVLSQAHATAYAAFQAHFKPFELLLERRARWCVAQQEFDTSPLDQEQLKAHNAKLERVEAEIETMANVRDAIWAIEEIYLQHLQKK